MSASPETSAAVSRLVSAFRGCMAQICLGWALKWDAGEVVRTLDDIEWDRLMAEERCELEAMVQDACDHRWASTVNDVLTYHCLLCGAPKVRADMTPPMRDLMARRGEG